MDSWVAFSEQTSSSDGGNDTLTGGEGADTMFGEGGDDTFLVGSAAEGAGDVITGGNGPDENTDNDILDLRGAGNVTINQSADVNDAGATAGTVTFSDGSTLQFSQIEQILTDPDVLADYTCEFFGPEGPYPVEEDQPAYGAPQLMLVTSGRTSEGLQIEIHKTHGDI